MPQIFPRSSNVISKMTILGVVIVLAVVIGVLVWYTHSTTFTKVGVAVPQPITFPHNLHVSTLGMNCRYCHVGVDQSAFADLPSTQTCMSCHSQIDVKVPAIQQIAASYASGTSIHWNRVNSLPDFVYFNHQIHVDKGVGCETCHGRMDQKTTAVRAKYFYMSTCVDCHKDPAQYLRPQANIYDMGYKPSEDQATLGPKLMKQYNILPPSQLTNCSICHR